MSVRRTLLLALACVLVAAPSSLAATTLTVVTPATASFAATLNGVDLTRTYALPMTVSYTSNAGNSRATLGWHLTATSTQFSGGGNTLATTASTITAIADDAGCAGTICSNPTPAASTTFPVALPAATVAPAAVTIFTTTAGTGVADNVLTATVSVSLPSNAFAGTYASIVTIAAVEGP